MNWQTYYKPPSPKPWGKSRRDQRCIEQSVHLVDLRDKFPEKQSVVLLGFACDEGVRRNLGRIGAAQGPDALRQELGKLPAIPALQLYDCGNIVCLNQDLEACQEALGEVVANLLQNDMKPILMGGGHEMAWGHYQGIAKAYPKNDVGIINLDAHFDLRPLIDNKFGSSGTAFRQIAEARQQHQLNFDYTCIGIQKIANSPSLFETAKSYRVNYVLAEEIYYNANQHCFSALDDALHRDHAIYLTLCLDVFTQAYAPGVSAPGILGLEPWQVIQLLRYIKQSRKIISFDIAELSPPLDNDHRTAKLAASLVWEYLHPGGSRV